MMTDEQKKFAIHAQEMFVTACPGAGKSTTIVERVSELARNMPVRKGIAVISFTNSAVENFIQKCRTKELDYLLTHPSFVGTFDSFVRQFLIIPGGIPDVDQSPLVLDDWDTLGIDVRLSGVHRSAFGVSLNKFDPETNIIDPSKLNHNGQRNHVNSHIQLYIKEATRLRNILKKKGYLSSADARYIAKTKLQIPGWANGLGEALSNRFIEVIVDEAQDCNPEDIYVLNWLKKAGIPVTVVSDPDQSIYEFRNGGLSVLEEFGSNYKSENKHFFTKNFRSSQPICDFSATLRGNINPDVSVGPNSLVRHPIQIMPYANKVGSSIGKEFSQRVLELDPSITGSIILSHSHKSAVMAAGGHYYQDDSDSKLSLLAKAVHQFWSVSSSNRAREASVKQCERIILGLMGKIQPGEHPSKAVMSSGLTERDLRRKALELISGLSPECDDTSEGRILWLTKLYFIINQINVPFEKGNSAKKCFQNKTSASWPNYLSTDKKAHCSNNNIHQVKGAEFEAVCVVIPPDKLPNNYTSNLFHQWENRIEHENKRVVYVGSTRAEKILTIALPIMFLNRLTTILKANNVSFHCLDIIGN